MESKIIGHAWAVDLLRRHLQSDATRHAYLLTGPDGVGRRTLARWFARALLCSREDVSGRPCGDCENCRLVSKGGHPDLHWVEDEGGIKIDDVRGLQHELSLTPYQAYRRIAVLPDFEMATNEAANALLKTLEEPAPGVVLILTAASEQSLLPTITSRCEVMTLRPMAIAELAKELEDQGEPMDQALNLAGQAMGRPGLAMRLKDDADELRRRTLLIEDGLRLLGMNRVERFEYAGEINQHKEPAENRAVSMQLLEAWLGLWREVLHRAHGVESQMAYPGLNLEIEKVAARVDPAQVVIVLREIEDAMQRIGGNANPLLALETVMLALPMVRLA